MTNDELTSVRVAIDDVSSPYTHSNDQIIALYGVLKGNLARIIYYLLMYDAAAVAIPTAPTEPTLVDPPTWLTNKIVEVWRARNQDKFTVWEKQLTVYRAEVDFARAKRDLLQNMAQSFVSTNRGRMS